MKTHPRSGAGSDAVRAGSRKGVAWSRLVLGSAAYHWRSHLGVIAGVMVAAAALVGALLVGDSVRGSLRARVLARLGQVGSALASGDRFFTRELVQAIQAEAQRSGAVDGGGSRCVWGIELTGSATAKDGAGRANRVQILGSEPGFWELAPDPDQGRRVTPPTPGRVHLNQALAARLTAKPGDTVVLRFSKPSALAKDAVLVSRNEGIGALRLTVDRILGAEQFGDWNLHSQPKPAFNAFVNADELARAAGVTNRANLMLVSTVDGRGDERASDGSTSAAWDEWLRKHWRLEDAEIEVRERRVVDGAGGGGAPESALEVATRRVFLDRAVVSKATEAGRGLGGGPAVILTYLANLLRTGEKSVPYSMVCGAGEPWTPPGMAEDEVIVTDWLAAELALKPGDRLEMSWFDPESGGSRIERTNSLRVRAVVPLKGRYADPSLMPEFPGLAKAESTRDWDAGFPLAHRIRDRDEDFWKHHRGTPKAYVHPEAARKWWGNRFGEATAVRVPVRNDGDLAPWRQRITESMRAGLRPRDVGLSFREVREEALRAAVSGQDFGQLFLGFSFFLIASALILTGLLFRFSLEQRLGEVGTLLALGFRPGQVRRLWLVEGGILAAIGGAPGMALGWAYAKGLVWGLSTIWQDAVASTPLRFHATAGSLLVGFLASVVMALLVLALTLRGQFQRPVRALLAGLPVSSRDRTRNGRARPLAWGAMALAVGLVSWAVWRGETSNGGLFFGVGALALVSGSAALAARLRGAAGDDGAGEAVTGLTMAALGARGMARRPGRSLATAGLLASGAFLMTSISAFRLDSRENAYRRDSGTGGFALVGETSVGITQDLNSGAGLEAFGLGTNDLPGVRFVPFRVREGDEASCLNLDRPHRPRLMGVDPGLLDQRRAFRWQGYGKGIRAAPGGTWAALLAPRRDSGSSAESGSVGSDGVPEVPGVGDAASIQWGLGRKLGDTLDFQDEKGARFRVRLTGGLANSVLQGVVVIDERAFRRLFPSESGYRYFLADVPHGIEAMAVATLGKGLSDVGAEWTSAIDQLARFQAVQNTYLATFQVLGGLGLLLGSAGLGAVVLRNVLERRGEFALLLALGFVAGRIRFLVLMEHLVLLGLGLGIGVSSAAVALVPAWSGQSNLLPSPAVAVMLLGAALAGVAAAWSATWSSLRGNLAGALSNE